MLSTFRAQNRSILSREIKDSSRLVERNRRPVSTRRLCLTHLAADPQALASETASRRKRKPSVNRPNPVHTLNWAISSSLNAHHYLKIYATLLDSQRHETRSTGAITHWKAHHAQRNLETCQALGNTPIQTWLSGRRLADSHSFERQETHKITEM